MTESDGQVRLVRSKCEQKRRSTASDEAGAGEGVHIGKKVLVKIAEAGHAQ